MSLLRPRLDTLPAALRGGELIQAAPATATYVVDRGGPVNVSFFGALVLGRVGDVSACADTGVRVASLLDLAAQKIRVVQVRAERKDYLDLATLMAHGVSLAAALGAAQALYPNFAPLVSLKALSYFQDGNLAELPDEVKSRLAEAAGRVRAADPMSVRSSRLT